VSAQHLLTLEAVCEKVSLSHTTVYKGIKEGTFPRPGKFGKRSLWSESEVDEWISQLMADRDVVGNMGQSKAA